MASQYSKCSLFSQYYSPPFSNVATNVLLWARNVLDLEPLHIIFEEGNGTPLQYSCLENPMGGGAW